jgi:hypothetical protein
MIAQYTLLTTLALHHIVIGGLLILILLVLSKILESSAEMRSWVLMTAFITSTLVPLTLLSTTPVLPIAGKQVSAQTNLVINEGKNQPAVESVAVSLPEQSLWHMPSEIVFQFSEILTALVIVWFIGSFWHTKANKRLYRCRARKYPKASR